MFLPTHDVIHIDDICEWQYVKKLSDVPYFYFDTEHIPNKVLPQDEKRYTSTFRDKHKNTPAIYRIYDKEGAILYIGESTSVYHRLKQHLGNGNSHSPVQKNRDSVGKIAISFFPIDGKDTVRDIENKLRKIIIHSIEQYFIMVHRPRLNGTSPVNTVITKAKALNSFRLSLIYEELSCEELQAIFGNKNNSEIRTTLAFLQDYVPKRYKPTV